MSFGEEDIKPLSTWRLEIKRYGKPHWLRFYKELLANEVSDYARFYRTLKLYGDINMFEAIIAASNAMPIDEPLLYVCKVAANKWREEQKALQEQEEYE